MKYNELGNKTLRININFCIACKQKSATFWHKRALMLKYFGEIMFHTLSICNRYLTLQNIKHKTK